MSTWDVARSAVSVLPSRRFGFLHAARRLAGRSSFGVAADFLCLGRSCRRLRVAAMTSKAVGMSNRLLNLVWGVERFGPSRSGPLWRLVMATLADRGPGDSDSCYPGLVDIASRTELGMSTVKRVLAGLKVEGWLAVVQKPGYGTVYRLNV